MDSRDRFGIIELWIIRGLLIILLLISCGKLIMIELGWSLH
jgi:hypothetical protein